MSLTFVRDTWGTIIFDAYAGPEHLLVFKTDAGACVALPQVQKIFENGPPDAVEAAKEQLTGPHGLASRPIVGLQTDALILLWESLRIVPRGVLHPTENPPRVLSIVDLEYLASTCWEKSDSPRLRHCYRDLTSAIERPCPRDFERCDVKVLYVDRVRFFAFKVKRLEHPELSPWYCPLASIAECVYGNAKDTVYVRREIAKKHPNLGEGSPHRWLASSKKLGRSRFAVLSRTLVSFLGLSGEAGQENLGSTRHWSFLSLEGAEQFVAKLPDRDPAFAKSFKRASLAVRGMDPCEIDLLVPLPTPARRLAIFSRREWLTDSMMANVSTLLLHRMKPNTTTRALYPASIDAVIALLRRYARLSDEKRKKRAIHHAANGGLVLCYCCIGGIRGGTLNVWTTKGHWVLLALDGTRRQCRYFDSLAAPPEPALRRAAAKALPTFAWVTELPDRVQVDGHSCGIWALWFGEGLALEAASGFSWEEHFNDSIIGFLRSGDPSAGEVGTKNAIFIAKKREAYRSLLESAIVDTSDLRLFEVDEDVDSWAVSLPASSRPPAPSPVGVDSSSSSSSSASDEDDGTEDGGSAVASDVGSYEGDGRPPTPGERAMSPASGRAMSPATGRAASPAIGGPLAFADVPPTAVAVRAPAGSPTGSEARQPYALQEREFGKTLRNQISAYKEWRLASLNPARKGNAIENSSLANDLGTIQRLLGYIRMRENVQGELTLDVVNRVDALDIILRFFDFLKKERGIVPGTLVGYCATLITLVGFVASRNGAPAGTDVPIAQALRNVKGQLANESKTERKWRTRKVWVEFESVLRGRLKAYEAFRDEEQPAKKAKYLRDCVLLGFLSISPARPGILQYLKLGGTLRKDNGRWNMSILHQRVQDGPNEGALTHKTAKRQGAIVVPLAEQCQGPLTEYVESWRRHLLSADANDQGYVFFTSSGDPYQRGSWTLFAKEAMRRWTGVAVPPRTMRAVVSTWVRDQAAKGQIEENTVTSVIEGTARLLQHTPRTASMHYDCNKTQREACAAIAWLEHVAAQIEGTPAAGGSGAALEAAEEKGDDEEDEDEDEEEREEEQGDEDDEEDGGGTGGGGEDHGSKEDEEEDDEEEDSTPEAERERKRQDRELAKIEHRFCFDCGRDFGTVGGKSRHRCSPRKSAARGRGSDDEDERGDGGGGDVDEATEGGPRARKARRGGRGRGCGEVVPRPAPEHTAVKEAAERAKRGGGRGGSSSSSRGGRPQKEETMGPPPAPWHVKYITPSPYPARMVAAVMVTRRGDFLPTMVFARLTATVQLPSGLSENRFVILRRFGTYWTPSNEGKPEDYTYPRAVVAVEYRMSGGAAIDVTTSAEEVSRRLAAAAQEAPPPEERDEGSSSGRGRGGTGKRRGRPPKNLKRGA